MHFSYNKENMINVLGRNKSQLTIPRYQRDYEWNEVNTSNYFEDILKNIKFNGEQEIFENDEYFFGTFLLRGKADKQREILEVIDGQQRLTTTVIFLSSFYHVLKGIEYDKDSPFTADEKSIFSKLSQDIFKKSLMTEEVNENKSKKTLIVETKDYFYENLIYENKEGLKPSNDAEKKMLAAHEYFKKMLSPVSLKDIFVSNFSKEDIGYVEMIMSIYEQLNCFIVVLLITESEEEATSMFESLNSKGAPLTQVDLIKNKIFSKMIQVEPLDTAKNNWINIKNELAVDKNWHNFDDFFETYWFSNIKTISKGNLYQDFLREYEESDEDDLNEFLEELFGYSKNYTQVFGKGNFDFIPIECRSDVRECVQILTNNMRIKQVNGLLLQLFHCYELKYINPSTLKKNLKFIADFHMIYNGLFKHATNSLRTPYFTTSQKIGAISRNNGLELKNKKAEITQVLNELRGTLKRSLPSIINLENMLNELEWSEFPYTYTNKIETKTQENYNKRTKYILYSLTRNENAGTLDHMNIEHIVNDSDSNFHSVQLGSLIMLETTLNDKCENLEIGEKITFYNESQNNMFKKMIENDFFEKLSNEKIIDRTKEMIISLYSSLK